MQEQLVSFKTAKLAREKGFNEICYAKYQYIGHDKGVLSFTPSNENFISITDIKSVFKLTNDDLFMTNPTAPTQSLLQKWLREKHNIDILILGTSNQYYVGVFKKGFQTLIQYFYPENNFKYENVLEIGLQESIKLI